MKKNDCWLSDSQRREIAKSADLLLQKAGAYGRFPTPIADLIAAAELELAREQLLDDFFLGEFYRSLPNAIKLAPNRLKRALDKVLGLLDLRARRIYLDSQVHKNKKPFLSLHEVAHGFLPWQRKTYAIIEDGESELNEDTRDEFERQANCFASDVLFQLDRFTSEAADLPFGMMAPIKLQKRYGGSVYAAVRRYVVTHEEPCAVLVFDEPALDNGRIVRLAARRSVGSLAFERLFGSSWAKDSYGPGEFFIEHLPRNKFSLPHGWRLADLNGTMRECTAEAFNSTKQVFFLIRSVIAVPVSVPVREAVTR